MFKKLFFLVSVVLVLSVALIGTARAELVGWWRLDEGSGTTAYDFIGFGNDGTLQGDPKWVAGYLSSSCLQFDGDDDYGDVPHADILTVDNEVSVSGRSEISY